MVLGLDVGRARIGVARAERGSELAFGRGAIVRRGTVADVAAVRALATAEGAATVVVGLPRPTRGEETPQTRLVRGFASALSRAGLEVVFEDERFTTALSERRLHESSLPREKRHAKGAVDEASAILILESYLTRTGNHSEAGDDAPGETRDDGPDDGPDDGLDDGLDDGRER